MVFDYVMRKTIVIVDDVENGIEWQETGDWLIDNECADDIAVLAEYL